MVFFAQHKVVFLSVFLLFTHDNVIGLHEQKICNMEHNNATIARAYYTGMAEKNIVEVEKYLAADVIFIAPLTNIIGKHAFLERVKEFFEYCTKLTIRVVFGDKDYGMVVFSLDYPEPIGRVEASALLRIEDGLITRIELFYDARSFEKI